MTATTRTTTPAMGSSSSEHITATQHPTQHSSRAPTVTMPYSAYPNSPQATTTLTPYMHPSPPTSGMIDIEQAVWAWILAGRTKHNTPIGKRLVKAFLAGVFLSTGGVLVETLAADPWLAANAPGLLKIMQGAVFPVGLVMLVVLQMDLLTGHMAIFILSTLKRKVPIWAFVMDWAIVLVGNLAGSLFFAGLMVYYSGNLTPAMREGAAAIATAKAGPTVTFAQTLARGVACNLLVCVAVFQASLARDLVSKIVGAWFPIFVFVSANYSHVIADMFLIPSGLMQGSKVSVGTYIWKVLISAGLGNILGAGLLVLPLLYLYGGEEFNPERSELIDALPPRSSEINDPAYVKDIERAQGAAGP